MSTLITRRNALELALASMPGVAALLVAQPGTAYASGGALAAAEAAGDETAASNETTASDSTPVQPVPEPVYSGATIVAKGKVKGSKWTGWRASSTVIGKKKGKGVISMRLKLSGLHDLTGGVSYRVYKRGKGWRSVASNGKATASVRDVEAIKVSLTGAVASHYDVLYRVYMSGRGWSKWVKNGASAGTVKKKSRVNAFQVKLTPKTVAAAGGSASAVGVRCQAYVRKTGWRAWVAGGQTAGTTNKSQALGAFALSLGAGALGGSITYRAYSAKGGWQAWKGNCKTAGSTARDLEAVQIALSGVVANSYDVYYRTHVSGYGWLDWAANGATAGGTGFSKSIEAFQVVLVAKGAAAPGATTYPTVNALEASKRLNGIDIASWQAGIDISAVPGDFVIVKATQGNWYTNPYFTQHAQATLACGKLLGAYHFADLRGSAKKQADYFVKKIKPYIGQCVLVLDWEADALTLGPKWAKKFLDRVYKKTGVKPLIYLSQSQTWAYNWTSVAASYRLWVAQYLYANMNKGYLSNPSGGTDIGYWSAATMYQYSSSGKLKGYGSSLDLNKFYGSAAIWKQLCSGE